MAGSVPPYSGTGGAGSVGSAAPNLMAFPTSTASRALALFETSAVSSRAASAAIPAGGASTSAAAALHPPQAAAGVPPPQTMPAAPSGHREGWDLERRQIPTSASAANVASLFATNGHTAPLGAAQPSAAAPAKADGDMEGVLGGGAAALPHSRAAFSGDRGTLAAAVGSDAGGIDEQRRNPPGHLALEHLQPSQLAPTRPASPSVTAAATAPGAMLGGRPPLDPGDLPNEVSAREVELRVLRTEVQTREAEASSLRDQVRDAELALQQASGSVGTLSAKVEATSGNRHAVLQASAKHIDSQVSGLRRRLARVEWELSQKDEEIATRRQAIAVGIKKISEQRGILEALHKSHAEHGQTAAMHEEEGSRLQRHLAIGEWRDRVHAQIAGEERDAALAKERRDRERQIEALDEDMTTFRAVLARAEDKCRRHTVEMKKLQQQLDALLMEERLHVSAARLGAEAAGEQRRQFLEEHKALETKIQEEIARKATKAQQARAYDAASAGVVRGQEQLMALIACTREASRALQDHHPTVAAGPVPHSSALPSARASMAPPAATTPSMVAAAAPPASGALGLGVPTSVSGAPMLAV
mmetsp:Transcript_59652/g.151144  ORF Transcript_59652/g.151144 Transcript_59652/m.151144 type:complete len:588 (+) Transcript_59652:62-1825(+)